MGEIHSPSGEPEKGAFRRSLPPSTIHARTRPKEGHKNELAQLKVTI